MNIQNQALIQIKKIKSLAIYFDMKSRELLIEKDKVFFTLKRNEIFPVLRGIIGAVQRFYRR
jgi:hypothetical protein